MSALCGLALLAACAHQRVPAYAGEDRAAQSGVPLEFSLPAELPEGTKVLWDFGDGTPPAEGAKLSHAFPRAGAFTVTQTVQDKDGDKRQSTVKITVLRRSVPMAVPADARATLVAQYPWQRVQVQREVAQRLGLRDFYEQLATGISRAVEFDVTSAEAVAQNGIDPDEGVAIYTVKDDAEALVVAVGVSDEAKADAALRKLLAKDGGDANPSLRPFALTDGKLPSGAPAVVGTRNGGAEQIAYAFKFGYLYLRTPAATDPLLALKSVDALQPDQGLERDATYRATVKRVGTGDFVFYSAPPPADAAPPPAGEIIGPLKRTARELGASALAIKVNNDRLDVRLFGQLRNLTGDKLVGAFTPSKNPDPEFARNFPAGAVAYVKLSGSPGALWREVGRAAGERKSEFEERLHAMSGIDVEKDWLPNFTGNAGVAFYLDAAAVLDAILGEQVAGIDRSTLLVAAEIADGKADTVKELLGKVAKEMGAKVQESAGRAVYRLGIVTVAQKGNLLYVSTGGTGDTQTLGVMGIALALAPRAQALETMGDAGKSRTLGDTLAKAGVRGWDLPHDQLLYLDIRTAVGQLTKAAEAQGGAIGLGAAMMGEKVQGIRDALLEARPSADGVDAELTVRFKGPTVSGHPGNHIDQADPPPPKAPAATCDNPPCLRDN